MLEITWFILDNLDEFKLFLKKEILNTSLIHMLMTYELGVQKYGSNFFTDSKGILSYLGMFYLESGIVNLPIGGTRTWVLGTWNERNLECWIKE